MIIWQGFGFLGAVIPILSYVLVALLVKTVFGPAYLTIHSWPGALGTLIGAGLIWLLSEQLDKPARTLVDPQTGAVVQLKKRHTLFWIPLRYFAALMALVAVGMLLLKTDSSL